MLGFYFYPPLGVVLCNRQVLEGVAQQGLCIAFIIWLHPRRAVRLCFLFVQPSLRSGEGGAGCVLYRPCAALRLLKTCLQPWFNPYGVISPPMYIASFKSRTHEPCVPTFLHSPLFLTRRAVRLCFVSPLLRSGEGEASFELLSRINCGMSCFIVVGIFPAKIFAKLLASSF